MAILLNLVKSNTSTKMDTHKINLRHKAGPTWDVLIYFGDTINVRRMLISLTNVLS